MEVVGGSVRGGRADVPAVLLDSRTGHNSIVRRSTLPVFDLRIFFFFYLVFAGELTRNKRFDLIAPFHSKCASNTTTVENQGGDV